MSAIEFAVRTSAGAVQRGFVGGVNAPVVAVPAGAEVSLNLNQALITGYRREGDMLRVGLVDGESIVIDNFFDAAGNPVAKLYLSTNGVLQNVTLAGGADGALAPTYAFMDVNAGKWSANDDLYFAGAPLMAPAPVAASGAGGGGLPLLGGLALPLLGLLGLGAGAVVLGSSESRDRPEDENPNAPVVAITSGTKETGTVVNREDQRDGATLTGTGTPNAQIAVTIDNHTQTTTVDAAGNWSLVIPPSVAVPGTYEDRVKVTVSNADGSRSVTQTLKVDTEVNVTFAAEKTGGDGVVNGAEQTATVRLEGTTDAGSSIKVTLGGQTFTATVTGTTWHLDLPAKFLPAPIEADQSASVTATDIYGNTATTTGTFRVDTFVNALAMDKVTADNILNRGEAAGGLTLTGVVEKGASLNVTFDGVTRAATVDASGKWSVSYSAAEIRSGQYMADVRMDATDAAGNTRSETGRFEVDTLPPATPLITAYTREAHAARAFSVAQAFDSDGNPVDPQAVTLTSVDGAGRNSDVAFETYAKLAKSELEYDFSATPIPDGSHLVMTTADRAGNSTSTLFVLEETASNIVNLGNSGYDGFNIEAIDLTFAQDAHLTLTAQDLRDLSAHSDRLVVHGFSDDTVVATGARDTGRTETIGKEVYKVYDFGGSDLLIDSDIKIFV